jgi:glucose/arabinose dehydrogenase
MHVKTRFAALAVLLSVVAAGCSSSDKAPAAGADSATAAATAAPTCPGNNAGLTLPAGFCATIFADSVAGARHVAVASNGDVYVAIQPPGAEPGKPAPPPSAAFAALRDTNHDGRADIILKVGTGGNTGIGLSNGFVYVDQGVKLTRYARSDTTLAPAGAAETVIDGIPMKTGHIARNFTIGSDGSLYLNVGSPSNSCQKKDRANESPGNDPCTELATRAGIWKFDANKTNQHFSSAARFATGIRNGMGLDFAADGKLYATQHGRDQLHDNWPKLFPTTKYQAENPAEELLQVNANDDFGWPYCYYSVDEKKLIDAPEYGGDGKKSVRCDSKKAPVATFPGHWAPMSLLFYKGSAFPAKYKDGAFIAFHGSWNRAPELQEGYRVVFQPLTNGAASGAYEDFANGFAEVSGPQLQPGTAKHRPTGLAVGPDGSLYITDDTGGRIYRVTHGAK